MATHTAAKRTILLTVVSSTTEITHTCKPTAIHIYFGLGSPLLSEYRLFTHCHFYLHHVVFYNGKI